MRTECVELTASMDVTIPSAGIFQGGYISLGLPMAATTGINQRHKYNKICNSSIIRKYDIILYKKRIALHDNLT